ncbi:MAG: hypothetical protein GY795_22705 [Desulfobacterales bacterium]|nr:hypothetical protein [Desulfobacterales bacterium]
MKNSLKRKMYMGFKGLMLPVPLAISTRGTQKGVTGAKTKAGCLSDEERRVHHFVVVKMAVAKEPVTPELIAEELCMPTDRVLKIIDKLENMKTFLYRADGKGINWAYPLSLENTGCRMTASSGERFFAA